MTISDGSSRWSYPGDGSQKDFAYTNKIFASTDLKVYVDSLLQSDTLYSVAGVGAEAGGKVTFGTAPSDGSVVLLVRDVPKTQATDIPLAGTFPSHTIEDAFDKLTILHQQNSDRIDRSLAPTSSDPDVFGAMPPLSTFFNKYLAFDDLGNPTPGVSLASQVVTYTADTFSGDGALTSFTLSASPASAAATAVFLSGVRQVPGVDYSVAATILTFTTAPPVGTGNILAVHTQAFTGVPSDLSVTSAKIVTGAVTADKIAAGAVVETGIGTDAVDWLTKVKAATAGDLPIFGTSGDPTLLAKGTSLQQLRMNAAATLPEWFTPLSDGAKAWVRWDSTGTTFGSFNVSSVTDAGVGDWTLNWTTAFANTAYATVMGQGGGNQADVNHGYVVANISAGSLRVQHHSVGVLSDGPGNYTAAAFGGQ